MKNIQKMNVFQQGLIWGILLGVVELLLNFIGTLTKLTFLNAPILIIGIAIYLFAGLRAAQETGKTGTGTLVGLLTALFASIISAIGNIITVFTNVDTMRQSSQSAADKLHLNIQYTNSMVITQSLLVVIGSVILALVLGMAAGAIGGAIGKRQAKNKIVPEY